MNLCTSHSAVQGHPEDGAITVASLTVLRRSSSLESFGVFSRGGRRAAVAGLASGSGFSVIGVVGVELATGFSSVTAGSVDGTGAGIGAGAVCSGAGSGALGLGAAVVDCCSCGGGLGSVVLAAGSGVSVGLGAGGGVGTWVAGL